MSLINVAEQSGGLVKTAGCDGCPDAAAVSAHEISGTGTLEFAAPESGSLRFVGLGTGGVGAGPSDIQFAIRLQGGTAEVRESGGYRSETSFAAGDRFSITVDGGVVRYARNGSVFYTSGSQAGYAVRAHVVFFGANGAVSGFSLNGGAGSAVPQPVADAPDYAEVPVEAAVAAVQVPDPRRYAVPRPGGSLRKARRE